MTFLAFTETKDTGKTKVWSVTNSNDGSYLGIVSWHGPWRKYCLFVSGPTIWSPDCLADVARFIEARMAERKKQPSKAAGVMGHSTDCDLMAGGRCSCR